jgi:hypothetical protein
MVHRDMLDLSQFLQIGKRELNRPFDEPPTFGRKPSKPSSAKRFQSSLQLLLRSQTIERKKLHRIHQDRKAAAKQKDYEKEIEELTASNPKGKSMRPGKVRINLGNGWNAGYPDYGNFDPGRGNERGDRKDGS